MIKNILVTGGSGFIGSHLVDQLKKYKVTVVDLKRPKKKRYKVRKRKYT